MNDGIAQTFARTRDAASSALVTYVMAGDPSASASRDMALACAKGGADILELGMPFSDPIADGPTIQRAAERSLLTGTTLVDVLKVAREIRKKTDAPTVLMGYVNPVFSYGLPKFLTDAANAGVQACILPDLPPEEAEEYCALAKDRGIRTVFLLAPTSTPARYAQVFRLATGFVYFVSVTGVTGARTELPVDLTRQLDSLRERSPVPVVVGFGVAEPAQVASLAPHADGVVVGSAIVNHVAGPGPIASRVRKLEGFVRSLKKATSLKASKRRR